MDGLFAWLETHEGLVGWMGALSVVTFVGSLLALPWLVIRIPPAYFTDHHRLSDPWRDTHPVLRIMLIVLKNLLGMLILLAGIAMLVLPGQGILTLLIGLMLIDFPGKFAFEKWIVLRPAVLRTLNWMRAKAHHPPLQTPASWHPERQDKKHDGRTS